MARYGADIGSARILKPGERRRPGGRRPGGRRPGFLVAMLVALALGVAHEGSAEPVSIRNESWQSARTPVEPFQYYELSFEFRANRALRYSVAFEDADGGRMVHGIGDTLVPGVVVADIGRHLDDRATVSYWVKLNRAAPEDWAAAGIDHLTVLRADNPHPSSYPWTDGRAYFNTFRSSRVDGIELSAAVDRVQRHMITITTEPGPGGWRLYQNAELLHQAEGEGRVTVDFFSLLGRSAGGHELVRGFHVLDGSMSGIRFYNRSLSHSEVSALYSGKEVATGVLPLEIEEYSVEKFHEHRLVFRAHPDAKSAFVEVHAEGATVDLKEVRCEPVSPDQARAAAARTAESLPPLSYRPPAGRWAHIPRTMEKLGTGGRLRVVMLGDSICNDTSNGLFELFLAEAWPEARIEVVTSVQGSRASGWFKQEDRVERFALRYQPDLIIIAGVSNRGDFESVRELVGQIRQRSEAEVLVVNHVIAPYMRWFPRERAEQFDEGMRGVSREEGIEFFDTRTPWENYIAGTSHGYFMRDHIHANRFGMQIASRLLARYLSPDERTAPRAASRRTLATPGEES